MVVYKKVTSIRSLEFDLNPSLFVSLLKRVSRKKKKKHEKHSQNRPGDLNSDPELPSKCQAGMTAKL